MDDVFVQPPEKRPKVPVVEATTIPVIDLSPLRTKTGSPDVLASKLREAIQDWGFFVVTGHGVPKETVARAVQGSRAFFALSAEEKEAVRRTEESPMVGYYDAEYNRNVRDWKEIFEFFPTEPRPVGAADGAQLCKNKWLCDDDLPDFRDTLLEYAKAMEELAFMLLELISRSLNLSPHRLHGFFTDQTTILRINHYPPCPKPNLTLGSGCHKDCGALTILYQDDVGGLDVRRRSDGEWVRVNPVRDSFVVNIGEIIQVWSNDKYESVEHRALVNSEKERFSIPYFFNPSWSTVVEPLKEIVSKEDPSRYNGYKWGEFYSTRRKAILRKQVGQIKTQTAQFKKQPHVQKSELMFS
ncbi:unnamed protein product [Urochloa decumbens]|uniref:Fe2OG dioxygenase domain-containing protein n=1 Tax=Urochloa decumbens TaxID=240449 RepID=A0ABC8VKE9_9POAL